MCLLGSMMSRQDTSELRGKPFAITTVVYKHMPQLVFNTMVFFLMHLITEKKVSGRKGSSVWSMCLAFCQQEINIQMQSQTDFLTFSHTCSHRHTAGSQGEPGDIVALSRCVRMWCNGNSMIHCCLIHSERGREAK